MNNNYEDLKQIIKAVKKPETEVELMSYKYLFELFEKAFNDESKGIVVQAAYYQQHFMEAPSDKSYESAFNECEQVLKTLHKEYQEIKMNFYKTLGGIND